MDFTKILDAIITVIVLVVTTIVIPYYKSKTSSEQRDNIAFWTRHAVEAAEKIYNEHGQGVLKKQYVLGFLASHGIVLDEQQLDVMIESAVLQMQIALSE
jgi:hypothetical protein